MTLTGTVERTDAAVESERLERVLAELAAIIAKLPPLGPWIARAACGTAPADVAAAFTADTLAVQPEAAAAAERVCAACPVLDACRGYADGLPGVFGLWAGQWRGRNRGKATKHPERLTA